MSDTKLYTDKSNTRRSAERMLARGEAPALDYTIKQHETASGHRYEIIWKTGEAKPEPVEAAAADTSELSPTAAEALRKSVSDAIDGKIDAPTMAALYLEWHANAVAAIPRAAFKTKPTTLPLDEALAGARAIGEFEQRAWEKGDRRFLMLTFDDNSVVNIAADDGPAPRKADKPRPIGDTTAAKNGAGWQAPQSASNGAAADDGPAKTKTRGKRARAPALKPGEMPVKPVITSAANKSYQGRVDKLAELAGAGDWAGVEAFVVNGVNTYAKVVIRYRDALVAAHRASA